MDLETGLLARFCRGLERILPVHVIHINVLLAVPTAYDVVNRSGVFDSHLAPHDAHRARLPGARQWKSYGCVFDCLFATDMFPWLCKKKPMS
jgi:hypothetical protein